MNTGATYSKRTRRGAGVAIALALDLLALLVLLAPAAHADIVFGDVQGPGAGQTSGPTAIAVDRSAGLLYVAESGSMGNARISVFDQDGDFVRAFGWGVADGTTAELQTCTTVCFKGLRGGGAGQIFGFSPTIAVDNDPASPSYRDIYVADAQRVQRFSTDDNGTPGDPTDDFVVFERAWGGGVITGGATGKGDLTSGSTTITNVITTSKQFALGQAISGSGIPAGTKIVGVGVGTITLSKAATASGSGVTLTVAEGAGNVPVNELETQSASPGSTIRLFFSTPNPSPSSANTTFLSTNSTSGAILQAALEAFPSVEPGDVSVTGPTGGPWTFEYEGRFADTNVGGVSVEINGGSGNHVTVQNGASAVELCTAANATDCAAGVEAFGAGQFASNLVPAVGSGTVHVADCSDCGGFGGTMRVQRFEPDGSFIDQPVTISGSEAGRPSGLAVGSGGDIYFASGGSGGVHQYDSSGNEIRTFGFAGRLAIDSTGDLFVATTTLGTTAVAQYDAAGVTQQVHYGNGTLNSPVESLAPHSSANGDIFVLEASNPRRLAYIDYEPPGPVVLPLASDTKATSVGNLTATLNTRVNPEGKATTVRFEYVDDSKFQEDGFANALSTPEASVLNEVQKVEVSATSGQFILSFGAETTADLPFDATAAQVRAGLEALPAIGAGDVFVSGGRGGGSTSNYTVTFLGALGGTDVAQLAGSNGTTPLSGAGASISTETTVTGGVPDFAPHDFPFEIACAGPGEPGCLTPGTVYHFRAVATNEDGTDTGPISSFETLPPISLGDTWSTDVGTDAATLHAQLNPNGVAATARFQYVTEAEHQANGFANAEQIPDPGIGSPPLDFGTGSSELSKNAFLSGLAPDTAYRYRYVANNVYGSFAGPEASFHTFALPDPLNTSCPNQAFRSDLPSAQLPDCRAYEMVSPLDKGGAGIKDLGFIGGRGHIAGPELARLRQATPDGSALTFSASRAFADPEGAAWANQYLASRDPVAGWQTQSITPPRDSASLTLVGDDPAFRGFTADLCTGIFFEDSDFAITPGDQAGFTDLYRRRNCDAETGTYELLTTAGPSNHSPSETYSTYELRLQGFSADGSKVVFRANDKLAVSGTPASEATYEDGERISQLYMNTGAALRLVSVLPNGTAAGTTSSSGGLVFSIEREFRFDILIGAVSADGSRVYWSTPTEVFGHGADNPRLYLRLNAERAQSPISGGQCTDPSRACTLPVSETISADPAQFLAATPDGARALYHFKGGSHSGELYLYDLASKSSSLIAPGVRGILGASEDLSRVYLVSTAVLDAGATAGKQNLYLHESGQGERFIATLSDTFGFPDGATYSESRFNHVSRVSPSGAHAIFLSEARLTGYDNIDARGTGEALAELFRYDAQANGGAGELRCLSCNPSGARPEGDELPTSNGKTFHWAAAFIPGYEYSMHASRVLSEDGSRVFFESYDALLPADTNEMPDVYQWQAPGTSECDTADANYFEPNGGCLSLISSGKSPEESFFVDASADGSDVFFTTFESLHGADTDDVVDIYDARALGGFPPPPPPPPPCEGEACRGASSRAAEIPGAGSAAFAGPGDPQPVFRKRCPKGKRKVRRRGKVRCVAKRQTRRAATRKRRAAR